MLHENVGPIRIGLLVNWSQCAQRGMLEGVLGTRSLTVLDLTIYLKHEGLELGEFLWVVTEESDDSTASLLRRKGLGGFPGAALLLTFNNSLGHGYSLGDMVWFGFRDRK